MDTKLRDFLKQAEQTHELLLKFGAALPPEQLTTCVDALRKNIRTIQAVSKRMADISNIASRLLNMRKHIPTMEYTDPYPTATDYAVLATQYPVNDEQKQITPNIKICVKTVERPEDIPAGHLYYIASHKQYAINLAGIVIRGTLGNIVPYTSEKSSRCKHGIQCRSFARGAPCKYYHDPDDYIKLDQTVPEEIRNFTVGSWIYSAVKKQKHFTRSVGSGNTLDYDIAQLKKYSYMEEITTREGQLIHDILIYLALNDHGLLERYKPW